jgi:hypothetical protein
MHRARVRPSLGDGLRISLLQEALRIFLEAMQAVCVAEVVSFALVLERSGGVCWIYSHAADGIDDAWLYYL